MQCDTSLSSAFQAVVGAMFVYFLEVFDWKDAVVNAHRNVTSVDDECLVLEPSQCIYLMRIHVSVVDPRAWIDLS